MNVMQMRRQGEPDGLTYSPHRDLANNFPSLATSAILRLMPSESAAEASPEGATAQPRRPRRLRSSWVEPVMSQTGVSEEDLASAVEAYVRGVCEFAKPASAGGPPTPREAMELAGFLAASPAAQLLVLAAVGQVLTGAFFHGLRETLYEDRPDPHPELRIADFAAAAATVADALRRPTP